MAISVCFYDNFVIKIYRVLSFYFILIGESGRGGEGRRTHPNLPTSLFVLEFLLFNLGLQ